MKTVLLVTLLLALSLGLFAHPASNVTLSWDAKTSLLTVSFEHSVKNPSDHFIKGVVIKLAGKEIINQSAVVQENSTNGSYVYKLLGIKSGTVIEAVTECNKIGKKSTKLTIK